MPTNEPTCRVCDAVALKEIPEFRSLPRVTSDCAPFREGGRLFLCGHCSAAQSPADQQWFEEIREIYRTYDIYHQSGGVEQQVLDPASGVLRRRSEVILDQLVEFPGFPPSGKVLDFGCGTGVTLRAFAERNDWCLYGLDLDERNLPFLKALARFEKLYTCAPRELPGTFDAVTMVHSLEHLPAPLALLRDLRSKIAPEGRLFVQVPNAEANPFEYLVADHMVHFSPYTLSKLVRTAGFTVDCLSTTWVTKELSLIARPAETLQLEPDSAPAAAGNQLCEQIEWLNRLVEAARSAAKGSAEFGIFGASIAGTWLCDSLGESVSFFVEEDQHRAGHTHMGRPMLTPAQVPAGAVVYVALIPQIARKVIERLRALPIDLRLPPA